MNKGTDLIQRQQIEAIDGCPTGNVYVGLTFEELAELEKELKALEIIVRKEVNIFWIKLCFGEFKGLEMYNTGGRKTLTREEYDLLKEIFDE